MNFQFNFTCLTFLLCFAMTLAISNAAYCPSGWKQLKGSKICLKVFEQANLNVGAAQGQCKKVGADLASVHDVAQDDVIKVLVNATSTPPKANATGTFYYLGLVLIRDTLIADPIRAINATFYFDGSVVDYGNPQQIPPGTGPWGTNEDQKEPNNFTGSEGCVAMKKRIDGNLAWVDISCDGSETQGFVCQKPALY